MITLCNEWKENEFFSKDGSDCDMKTRDANFSAPNFPIAWNVCRQIKDKVPIYKYAADLGNSL